MHKIISALIGIVVLAACGESPAPHKPVKTAPQMPVSKVPVPTEPLPVVLLKAPAPKIEAMGPYMVDTAHDCDGYARVSVSLPDGLCMGLVANVETPTIDGTPGLMFPRDILFPSEKHRLDQEILIVDMGGWSETKGRLLSLNNGKLETVLSRLKLPHALEYGPDEEIYLAQADKIVRVHAPPMKSDGYATELIIQDLPYRTPERLHLHPLKAFAFQDKDTLWVNTGSVTDRCFKTRTEKTCGDRADTAVVMKYTRQGRQWMRDEVATAHGLRNSMGLAAHSSGTVLQAGNGSDYKDADLPPEELNVLEEGAHYGWPYCYGMDGVDPGWPNADFKCNSDVHSRPIALLPAHGAPLDLLYAPAGTLGFEREKLIVPLHGYRDTGHRILMFDVDDQGLPVGEPAELVAGWGADSTKPRGAPVGLTIGPDGALWGVEDKNKTVFRIAKDTYQPQRWAAKHETPEIAPDPAFAKLHADILMPKCAECHDEFLGTPVQSLTKLTQARWIGPDATIDFTGRLIADPPKQMPPLEKLPEAEIEAIQEWLDK